MFLLYLLILLTIIIIFLSGFFLVKKYNNEKNSENFSSIHSPVVLQSWDQYYVSTKSYDTLREEIEDLSPYFTDIIIPPLSKSKDIGFVPTELFDFNSNWGSEDELYDLLKELKKYKLNPISMVVTHNRTGDTEKWFKYTNPTFLDNDVVYHPPYYNKYLTTMLYSPWGLDENAPKDYYLEGLPPDFDENGVENCYTLDSNKWKLYKGCRDVLPLYGVPGKANIGWLQGVNYCNVNVLKAYIKFIKILKNRGINGIILSQADAISPEIIALFINSDINKTPLILEKIIKICKDAEMNKNQTYHFEDDIRNIINNDINSLTSVEFDIAIIDNFYGELYGVNEKEIGWRGLLEMPVLINENLNKSNWCSQFDFSLKFILNKMLNTPDMGIDGREFIKENMVIGNDKFKSRTITLVDNHDTDYLTTIYGSLAKDYLKGAPGNEINFYGILPAYFIIMFLPGTPMVHKLYYDVYKKIGINDFIKARNECCIDNNSDFTITKAEVNDVAWVISKLNLSIKPIFKDRLIKVFPTEKTKILLEINNIEPTETNVYHKRLVDKNLLLKISFIN